MSVLPPNLTDDQLRELNRFSNFKALYKENTALSAELTKATEGFSSMAENLKEEPCQTK